MAAQQRVIKVSLKGIAKYITVGPAAQRRVVQDFKYPNADEPFAMRTYYREAKDRVKAFHREPHGVGWLHEQANHFARSSDQEKGTTATRLAENARALRDYERVFGSRHFELLERLRLRLTYGDVVISIAPDLHVREDGDLKLFKIQFGGRPEKAETIQIMTQCMLEAARVASLEISHDGAIYLDLPRGIEHHARPSGKRILHDVKAACQTISQLWDSIPPPSRTSRRSAAA